MKFVEALKIWNKDKEGYTIPRKGTQAHAEVMEIMNNLPDSAGKKGAGLKRLGGKGMKRLGGEGMSRLGGCMKCELSPAHERQVHKLGMGLKRLGYNYEKPQRGGFLPALLAMLPSLGTVGTAVGSALSGAAAGKLLDGIANVASGKNLKLLDGIANVASGKNFFTGKGHGDSCFCHHLVRNKDYNKCKKCAGVTGGNIMDIVPFFTRQVEALAKNPFVKEVLKQGKKLASNVASNVAGLDVKGLEDAVNRVVKGRGMKKKKK